MLSHIKEINIFVDSLTNKSNQKESSSQKNIESNFGKSFYDFQAAYNQYFKVSNNYMI